MKNPKYLVHPLKNKFNMKHAFLFILLFSFTISVKAQFTDIYQNKKYEIHNLVLKAEIKAAYSPSQLEIVQSRNEEKPEDWAKVEDKIFDIAVNQVKNEISFFKIQSKAIDFRNRIQEWKRINGRDSYSTMQPNFTSIDIDLVSVLNNCAVYAMKFNFVINKNSYYGDDEAVITQYYFANFKKGTVTPFNEQLTQEQQNKLKDLCLNRFKKLYLLQTQKLALDELDNDEKMNLDHNSSFASKIFFSEAIIYPYLAGVIVEFPQYSNSSKLFFNYPVRVFLKGNDVQQLLKDFPIIEPAFSNPLKAPTPNQIEQLNNDENFNLIRFSTAPKELDMLEYLDPKKSIYTLSIDNIYHRDTTQTRQSTKKFFFNKQGLVTAVETRDGNDKLFREERFTYNENAQLIKVEKTSRESNIDFHYYNGKKLNYIEKVYIDNDSRYDEDLNVSINQEHFIYNGNYRYQVKIHLTDEFKPSGYQHFRYLKENKYCTNSYCLLLNENKDVVGVRLERGSPMDILTNENNQAVESFLDYDRHHHQFSYDDQNRILELRSTHDRSNGLNVNYEYSDSPTQPLIIKEEQRSYSNVNYREYIYRLEFYNH
ncbi:hypothetical protein [Brumimicrobium aurantiacum]|uniref:Uncharacterized protein n=1 Tax=Brumimicrobium aurantiacum TaxID=1737063 RepID=A0A3E1F088_9FLAO|nr:hypothetical protein [Brumimicrobium aurantiacum]RFC55220.1 hypothetical protein DXU93_05205 [Brumimicrobium aurantiacum]